MGRISSILFGNYPQPENGTDHLLSLTEMISLVDNVCTVRMLNVYKFMHGATGKLYGIHTHLTEMKGNDEMREWWFL